MKLFSYIDDGLNWLIVNVFEKISDFWNIVILALLLMIIFVVYEMRWGYHTK